MTNAPNRLPETGRRSEYVEIRLGELPWPRIVDAVNLDRMTPSRHQFPEFLCHLRSISVFRSVIEFDLHYRHPLNDVERDVNDRSDLCLRERMVPRLSSMNDSGHDAP